MANNVMRKTLNVNKSTFICMFLGELGHNNISKYIENTMLLFG